MHYPHLQTAKHCQSLNSTDKGSYPKRSWSLGSCETYTKSRKYALGFRPSDKAFSSDIMRQAEAPSV